MNHLYLIAVQAAAGIRHHAGVRRALSRIPPAKKTVDVEPRKLRGMGLSALVLDFDGVLSPHGNDRALPEAEGWIDSCLAAFGRGNVHVLSNNPTERRARYFADRFPGVSFLSGIRKKPHPDGVLEAARISGVDPGRVAVVDDRILTGVLSAVIAGAAAVYITDPYVDHAARPAAEAFFSAVRAVERALFLP